MLCVTAPAPDAKGPDKVPHRRLLSRQVANVRDADLNEAARAADAHAYS